MEILRCSNSNTLVAGGLADVSVSAADLLARVGQLRVRASRKRNVGRMSSMGQFLTPPPIAEIMASMLSVDSDNISVLDAGAGVGTLFAACVAALCQRSSPPRSIHVVAYEIEPVFLDYLAETIGLCAKLCDGAGVAFSAEVRPLDFLRDTADVLTRGLFSDSIPAYDCAILNPPYKKIGSNSEARKQMRRLGVETGNLYAAFLAAAVRLLKDSGELVAITPRSFCNGPYFRKFRRFFLERMSFERIRLFESRQDAFRDDDVLQETMIFKAVKTRVRTMPVYITSSQNALDEVSSREIGHSGVVDPKDPELFIHIVTDEVSQDISSRMQMLACQLAELPFEVSTGRVVDFRSSCYLRHSPSPDTAPLIYPLHFSEGYIAWPKDGAKKPNAIAIAPQTESLLVPSGYYVLVKRLSSKEEKRRVVAAVYDPGQIQAPVVGFENHVNYFHVRGKGLDAVAAKGLCVFLNSSLVDMFFRQFNGHTQVNATDLRKLRYPAMAQLQALGQKVSSVFPSQDAVDRLVEGELFRVVNKSKISPVTVKKRVEQAQKVLESLGLPSSQLNERSAMTLLALANVGPRTPWAEATNPIIGVTPVMDFIAASYGKTYKPNTRESVRKETIHQFVDAAIVVENPDDPNRPTNSPNYAYQIDPSCLELIRSFGSREWEQNLQTYLASVETLKEKYAQERAMKRIPVQMPSGQTISLSPGNHNILIKKVLEQFAPCFAPASIPVYIGDTDDKFVYFNSAYLTGLGVSPDMHGKMPDVILHYVEKDWLILVEAVTSRGPVDPKRHSELLDLFARARPGLVFVTAFLTRKAMTGYLADISWETDVWVAESPSHLIHFDGARFLGPYQESCASD